MISRLNERWIVNNELWIDKNVNDKKENTYYSYKGKEKVRDTIYGGTDCNENEEIFQRFKTRFSHNVTKVYLAYYL